MIRKRRDGLQVQVYAGRDPLTGHKRYVSQQVPGQTKASMREAKQIEARLLEEVGAGRHKGSPSRTVAELLERWLEWRPTVRPIAPTTVSSYRAAMGRYILPALGKLPVRQVDAATLDAFYARLRTAGGKGGRPLKASTVHEVHAVLSGALRQAVAWGWIGHNPAKQATAPSVQKADVQPPQAEDAARLLSAAMAEDSELGLFLRLAVMIGARRGELCALRWNDVDVDQGEVLIAGNVVRVPKQALVHKDTKTTPSAGSPWAPARSSCCAPAGSPRPRRPWPSGPPWQLTPTCSPMSPTGPSPSTLTASPTGSSGWPAG